MNKKILHVSSLVAAAVLMNLSFINMSSVDSVPMGATGLSPLTPEEIKKLHKLKVKKVHLNKLGLERVNKERREKGLPDLPEAKTPKEEVEIEAPGAIETASTTTTSGTVPAMVDNSALPSFPPISSQGSLPSCTAWATTYYQMSHQVCLTLGCNNKTSNAGIYSPKWTYNIINGGSAVGTSFSNAYGVLEKHGAARNFEFPYSTSDYRSWSMNPQHWRTAIGARMAPMTAISVSSDAGMANAKTMLANGNVLVIATYINSWNYRTVQADPSSSSNPFVGQSIVTHQSGTAGLHAMTLVGYDDRIWVDLNSNGVVEAAERGAFKIANSWGTGYKNAGYIWVSYDSIRTTSAVPGFAPSGRNQLIQSGSVYSMVYKAYTPKLLALVRTSHAARSQVRFQFGSSSTSATSPQATLYPKAFYATGGAYAFNGTTTEVEGEFYFDISSLYTASAVDQQRFYLTVTDSTTGSPLTVRSFQLIDPASGATLNAAAGVPIFPDGGSATLVIGNVQLDTAAPSAPSSLTATKTSVKKGKRITTSIALKWGASTDNVGVAKYRVYRNGVKIAEPTSLSYSDSSGSAGVLYTYVVKAVDAQGNESAASNSVQIVR